MPLKFVSIIVLHYKNIPDTRECLQSLLQINYPHFEILLVDNGSKDPSLDTLSQLSPRIHLVKHAENLGFAEGNNRALILALERGAEYCLLLNNDTVVHKEILNAFIEAAEAHPQAGVFGAKIYVYDEPTTLWHTGGEVDPRTWRCFHLGCGEDDLEKQWENVHEISYACGCALFLRKEVIETVGVMDPRFFLLWEEIDWCWRIRSHGFECLFVPKAKLWHKISASFEGGNRGLQWTYFYYRNRLLFLEKQQGWKKVYSIQILREIKDMIVTLLSPKTAEQTRELYRYALKGVGDYFLRRFGRARV